MIPKARLRLPDCAGIYLITCKGNDKIYIGSSTNLQMRWREHKSDLRHNRHPNRYLQNTWNKYGESSFTFAILEKCSREDLFEREQHYLDTWKPFAPNGMNIGRDAKAAQRGRPMTPEHRAKISAANKGKTHTAETRALFSAIHTGKAVSAETREKLRRAATGKRPNSETRERMSAAQKGHKLTPEQCAARSARLMGHAHSDETRAKIGAAHSKTYVLTSSDGTEIKVKGLKKFCRESGMNSSMLYAVLAGKRSNYKGWTIRKISPEQKEE